MNEYINACYLYNSGLVTKEYLDIDDDFIIWDNLLRDDRTPEEFKLIVLNFYKKYEISPLKYRLNKDYISNEFGYLGREGLISPSLRKAMLEYCLTINMFDAYPKWFYTAFPDVYWWAKNEGNQIVMDYFKRFPLEELFDNKKLLKLSKLTWVIEIYIEFFSRNLECKKYYYAA